jgi:uncharacterized protein
MAATQFPGRTVAAAPALSQYVLKVHSRCDLACDHCYVYEHADQTWRGRPRLMAPSTVRAAAERIAEHAAAHELRRVRVVLHGGEPLLAGADGLRDILAVLRGAIEPRARLDLGMQSNGILLTGAICDVLAEHGVRIGISLDGDREANDRHRRYSNGASSHDDVLRALALLRRPAYRHLYAGLLCTVDVENDPIAVYEALLAQEPPRIDFLLPHATWDNPPPRPGGVATPYARWLLRIHERWVADGRPVAVRTFDSITSLAAGGPSGSEALGPDAADLAVIETDGAWEQVDSVKVAYHDAAATGLNVFAHPVDEVAAHPAVAARQAGVAGLCDTCRACPVVRVCGGGLYPHRYRGGSGFHNPSVYCADLKELIVTMGSSGDPAQASDRPEPSSGPSPDPYTVPAGLPLPVLDQFATGFGDEAAMRELIRAEAGYTRALVVAAADSARTGPAAEAWAVLTDLDRVEPWIVTDLLAHPYVRKWATGVVTGGVPDHSYLCGLAAAAALRARRVADVPVPVADGRLHLPTLGTQTMSTPAGVAWVVTGSDGGRVRLGGRTAAIPPDGSAAEGWRPVRRIDLGTWRVLLDDLDPHRDCFDWPAEAPLSRTGAAAWERSFGGAWRLIRDDAPALAVGIRAALRAVTPLAADPDGRLRSAAARHAFGAVGIAPAAAANLATLIVHEVQHNKLSGVLDLCYLFDPRHPARLRVPWRPDPRPVEGALHGAYAHLGMAALWRTRALTPGSGQRRAWELFRTYRDWTVATVDELRGTGALTPHGQRFVDGMAGAVAAWRAD